MALFGYFGKVPAAADFVFHGLPMRTCDLWADHMAEWLAVSREMVGDDWTERFLTSPVWRFVISKNVIGPQCWVGVLAGSIDSVGRTFPFTAMIAVDMALQDTQPISLLDPRLDRVEGHLLSFIEGHISQETLMKVIGDTDAALARDLGTSIWSSGNAEIKPADGDRAVCLCGPSLPSGPHDPMAAFRWPSETQSEGPRRLCLWWHDAYHDRNAELCVSRGLPPRESVIPFFLGDWEGFGWTPCDPAAYLDA